MTAVEGEGPKPGLRRYIKDSDGSVEHEKFDKEEGTLRFSAIMSHVGLVKLLQNNGGDFHFGATVDEVDDLLHYAVGLRTHGEFVDMFLIRKPETDLEDLT